jgi:branched-subunit amino acid transport protein
MANILIFVGMGLATYFTRYAMIAALGKRESFGQTEAPSLLQRWLRYVPPAVLAALIAPEVLAPRGELEIGLPFWATLVGAVVAWRTRSTLWTVLGGMTAFWLLRLLNA